jgi:CBS domain containing-hemolysin-like protein
MTGAMDINSVLVQEILTPIYRVDKLYLGTVLDQKVMRVINDRGFSRVPIALSEENPIIVGILLVKSLISVESSN